MNREEFEKALRDFEIQVKKKLPGMINTYLMNRGNREFEIAFTHLLEMLQKTRRELLKDVSKVARHEQKVRYFNAVYNLDSQLRSMGNKELRQKHLKFRRRRMAEPVVYDIGEGPETGDLLNVDEEWLLIKTAEKVSPDKEIKVSISGKQARGKAMWSVADDSGSAETGVRFVEVSEEFLKEIREKLKD
ncbi:MAG: hypothetical protein WAR22_13930 [Desulfomonilia bacterium]|jgi:hypothetical protein